MQFAFDHAVVTVPALEPAVRAWRDAGFVVVPGGRHEAIPSENALVVFAAGDYLELLAVRDAETRTQLETRRRRAGWEAELRRAPAIARRFLPRLAGPPGVGDAAWRGSGLERFAGESRRRGFAMTGPVAMTRERPDGTRLEWSLLLPVSDRFPFLIEDHTPHALRVGDPATRGPHPNGADRVAEVLVRVPSVATTALEWADLFGIRPVAEPGGGTRLVLGGTAVRLAEGEPEGVCGVRLAGVGRLPAALTALGVRGESDGGWPGSGGPIS